jgi:hypothetical protein
VVEVAVFVGDAIGVAETGVEQVEGDSFVGGVFVHSNVVETLPKLQLGINFVEYLFGATPVQVFGLECGSKISGVVFVLKFAEVALNDVPVDVGVVGKF